MGRYGHAEHDNDTITRWHLKRALGALATSRNPVTFGGYFSTDTLADAVIDNVGYTTIDSITIGGNMTKPKPTDTITFKELDDAITQLGYYKQGVLAEKLFSEAVKVREPKWKTGDIVRSAAGNVFVRRADGDWEDLPGRRTHGLQPNVVKDTTITRPLTLVGRAV
jgi:hypothetical protein